MTPAGGWSGGARARNRSGPADAPLVIVRHRRALRRLMRQPGRLGLARAHVAGEIDVRPRPSSRPGSA